MRWEWILSGLGALAIVTILGILIVASSSSASPNGVWLIAFLPLAAVIAGAILLAGREPR